MVSDLPWSYFDNVFYIGHDYIDYIDHFILNTFRFTSPILLETNILPNGSSMVLQLPLDLFILLMNG